MASTLHTRLQAKDSPSSLQLDSQQTFSLTVSRFAPPALLFLYQHLESFSTIFQFLCVSMWWNTHPQTIQLLHPARYEASSALITQQRGSISNLHKLHKVSIDSVADFSHPVGLVVALETLSGCGRRLLEPRQKQTNLHPTGETCAPSYSHQWVLCEQFPQLGHLERNDIRWLLAVWN